MAKANQPHAALHLLTALAMAAAILWLARHAADSLINHLQPAKPALVAQSAPSAEEEASRAAAMRQRRLADEQARQDAERLRREQQRNIMLQAREEAAAVAREAEERKLAAWNRFYRKPKKCDAPPDNASLVECSNHYLREQARFEKSYAATLAREAPSAQSAVQAGTDTPR